jgi:hypothetical protein
LTTLQRLVEDRGRVRWALVVMFWAGTAIACFGLGIIWGLAGVLIGLGSGFVLYAVVGRIMMGVL